LYSSSQGYSYYIILLVFQPSRLFVLYYITCIPAVKVHSFILYYWYSSSQGSFIHIILFRLISVDLYRSRLHPFDSYLFRASLSTADYISLTRQRYVLFLSFHVSFFLCLSFRVSLSASPFPRVSFLSCPFLTVFLFPRVSFFSCPFLTVSFSFRVSHLPVICLQRINRKTRNIYLNTSA
jgi:hypothetical protein